MKKIFIRSIPPFYLFLLFLFLTYISLALSINLPLYDDKRIGEIFFVFLALLHTFLRKPNIYFLLPNYQKTAFIALLALLILSSLLSKNPSNAALESSLLIGLFFFSLTISSITKQHHTLITLFFLITISVSTLLYLTSFFSIFIASFIENIPLKWPEPFNGFSNIRFFNQYQVWTISLLPLPLLIYPTLDKRLLISLKIIAIGWAVLLFASGSRGAVISIVLAMFITLITFKQEAKSLIKLNTTILISGAITYLILFKLIPPLLDSQIIIGWKGIDNITHSSGRIALWQLAIQYILDNPWLGIGPMHYAYYPGPTHGHPHNSLLQWASEMGIPSTLLLLTLVSSGLYSWVNKFHRLNQENNLPVSSHLWLSLFCSICSGLIYSLVSGVIVMPLSQVMMAFITGWMLGLYFLRYKIKKVTTLQHYLFILLAGLTLTTLTYTLLPTLLPRIIPYSDSPRYIFPSTAPRFWQITDVP